MFVCVLCRKVKADEQHCWTSQQWHPLLGVRMAFKMSDESLERIERQLASLRPDGAPAELRGAVLAGVRSELRAARWDRRLARAAVVLLAVGVGMNVIVAVRPDGFVGRAPVARGPSQATLLAAAATVAEATDAETGIRFAHQLAALGGVALDSDQSSAIDAAARERAARHDANGKDG